MIEAMQDDINQLNSFLRAEISAVETYRCALTELGSEPEWLQNQLSECLASHHRREVLLTDEILRFGGSPADGTGPWREFAKLTEAGASAFAPTSAVAVLLQGEELARREYARDISDLSPVVRGFVQSKLVPEQERTQAAIGALMRII